MAGDVESVLDTAEGWIRAGRRVAWATVVDTWRSSPRPIGSQMIIADDGQFAGSVSGGCVEGAVIQAALELLGGGTPQLLGYGVTTEMAWEVGLPCGGQIEILLMQLDPSTLARLALAWRERRSVACVFDLELRSAEAWEPSVASQIVPREGPVAAAVAQAFREEQSRRVESDGRRLFVHMRSTPLRIVVVGAVHLTQVLGQFVDIFGFELTVVDPRSAFATPARFPRAHLVQEWPDVALASLGLDRRTAVVLSHDAKLDEPALVAALRSDCFYVGALGSQRTQQARRRRLLEEGIPESALARLHGPVGLDIGAVTTPEIALSILAELIQIWRQPGAARIAPDRNAEGGPRMSP